MIITVCSRKGGVGKSVTAIHLACYFREHGSTLLIDDDPNRSAIDWAHRGELPYPVLDVHQASPVMENHDYCVIDTEASPDANELNILVNGCDLIVVPCIPDALALQVTIQTCEALSALGSSHHGVLLTMVDSRKKSAANEAREALNSFDIPCFSQEIRRFTAYERAAALGVPVYQSGDRMRNIAWNEYQTLGRELEGYAQA